MLTPKEWHELTHCLKLRERRIITDHEISLRLATIARRGKLDAIIAEIPHDLAGLLKECVEAGPPEQAYSPAALPSVTMIDALVLDSDVAVSRVDEFIRIATVRHVGLVGEAAQAIASLWRQLPPDHQARCHIPPYGLRFYAGTVLVCEASICWQCNNIYGQAGGEALVYQFDAEAPISRRLLAAIRQAVGDQPAA